MRAGDPGPLAAPEDHASAMLAIYRAARLPAGANLDLETPLIERLAHFERRLGDLMAMLARSGGGAS
jgi:hypothetical protein